MNHNIPQGTIDAARVLLAEPGLQINQVYEIVLRDADANDENPRTLFLVPIGAILGVAITTGGTRPVDKDFIFVSMSAFGNCLPALGFTARVYDSTPIISLVPPK